MMHRSVFAVAACAFFLFGAAPSDAKPVKSTTCGKPFDKTIDGAAYSCTKCTTTTTDCNLADPPQCTVQTDNTTTCDPKKASTQGSIRVTPDLQPMTVDPGVKPVKPKRLETAPLQGEGTLAPAQ